MIDIETLGIRPTSKIISIGAVRFSTKILDKFYVNITPSSNLGRTVDKSTLEWWSKQSDKAKQAFLVPRPIHLKDALIKLSEFIGESKVWAWNKSFEARILENAYHQFDLAIPWNVIYEAKIAGHKRLPTHNALQDAIDQAEALIKLFRG